MTISLELKQTWDTAQELYDYLGLLQKTIGKIIELGGDAPTEWYFHVDRQPDGSDDIFLTHL